MYMLIEKKFILPYYFLVFLDTAYQYVRVIHMP